MKTRQQICYVFSRLVAGQIVLASRAVLVHTRKIACSGTALYIGGLLCTGCNVRSPDNQMQGTMKWKFVSAIHLGIESPGTEVAEFERDTNVMPNSAVIRVTTSTGSFFPDSLEQFRGLVHIDDAKAAMRFVRFRTSRKYCYNWDAETTPQEIVSFSQYIKPNFADTGGADDVGYSSYPSSGRYGLLSDQAYREGKFQALIVKAITGGYEVVRWVCIYSDLKGDAIQLWQEEVQRDGTYKRIILKTMQPPKLAATEWHLMGLQ